MKKHHFLAVVLLLIIVGCTSQVQQPGAMPQKNALAKTDTLLNQVYQYGSVKEYKYKLTSYSENKTTNAELKTTVSSDNVDNTPSWLTETDVIIEEASSKTETWMDKNTLKCLKIMIETSYGGKIFEQEMPCPDEGIVGTSRTSNEAKYIATESITVPMGTFTANKYEVASGKSKIYLWASADAPIPLKVEQWSNEKLVSLMELESYS
jgi:hypothetical protein